MPIGSNLIIKMFNHEFCYISIICICAPSARVGNTGRLGLKPHAYLGTQPTLRPIAQGQRAAYRHGQLLCNRQPQSGAARSAIA